MSFPWKAPQRERQQKLKRSKDYCESCQKPLYRTRYTTCHACRDAKGCSSCGAEVFRRGMCRLHYDKDRFAARPKCSEDDCKSNAKHLGLCRVHYRELKENTAKRCEKESCQRAVRKRGLCGTHYQSWRTKQPRLKCSRTECSKNAFKYKLCFSHWRVFDPDRAFLRSLRTRITNSINQRYKKNDKTEKILGATIDQVRSHLESKFTEGMEWSNHGKWHIEHICPCSQAQNEEELIKLQHYTNLQPMWGDDNFAKKDHATPDAVKACVYILDRDWVT